MLGRTNAISTAGGGGWIQVTLQSGESTMAGGGISFYGIAVVPIKNIPYAVVIMPTNNDGEVTPNASVICHNETGWNVAAKVSVALPDMAFTIDQISSDTTQIQFRVGIDGTAYGQTILCYVIYESM